jgi:molecular chaperone DnaK (HSP70)
MSAEDQPRYAVGIDLGTTNCAVGYVDFQRRHPVPEVFKVGQVTAPGEFESLETLPSFCYQPAVGEFKPESLRLPGEPADRDYVVGVYARRHGAEVTARLISSAKSWLCHPNVNRTAPLLPWHGAPDIQKASPVEVSARYLRHIRERWDAAFPGFPLHEQDVMVTVPASFDEAARELTVKAAEAAGLPQIHLLEEPQAAFYAWMQAHATSAADQMKAGRLILVCDVGGGTSDFTLIKAQVDEQGELQFRRIAVGEHLILGGDNMDLALAKHVENRLQSRLDPRRWGMLVQACRHVKEMLLGTKPQEKMTVHVAGGSRLIGGALQLELAKTEVESLLVDGFFPHVSSQEKPAQAASGFQEFGLPYASDPAVTRHLAAFLTSHQAAGEVEKLIDALPDTLLFNGGVFESPALKARLMEVINSWREAAAPGSEPIRVLPNERLDLAVAMGAAWFGVVRRNRGLRISAGLARAYYTQVSVQEKGTPVVVCLAPAGMEEGTETVLQQIFSLRLREPVEFALYTSNVRLYDKAGDLLDLDPVKMAALPPLRTVIKPGKSATKDRVDVRISVKLTEIGTLDVRCLEVDGNRSWKLEFDVRGTSRAQTRRLGERLAVGALEESVVEPCRQLIKAAFTGERDPAALVKKIETAAGLARDAWPLSLLRPLWEALVEVAEGRQISVAHETRWLNLLGFSLRPGYGYAVDDWRVEQTWKFSREGVVHRKNEWCQAEWWILWRRIAGGLTLGQQKALADPLIKNLKSNVRLSRHEGAEIIRLLGALELLPEEAKILLGSQFLGRFSKAEESLVRALWWALGRLGARVPAYGPLNCLVPAETVEGWLSEIIKRPDPSSEALFAVAQMARRTEDRYRDISEEIRAQVSAWMKEHHAPSHGLALVQSGGLLDTEEEQSVFGDTLPPGLHLQNE